MIDKQKLIKLLEDCIKLEADAIPLYTQKIESPSFFHVFPVEDRERVKKAMKALADDSRSHQRILEMLLVKARGSEKNEF